MSEVVAQSNNIEELFSNEAVSVRKMCSLVEGVRIKASIRDAGRNLLESPTDEILALPEKVRNVRLGVLAWGLGEENKALELLAGHEKNPLAAYALAKIYCLNGRYEDAKNLLEKAFKASKETILLVLESTIISDTTTPESNVGTYSALSKRVASLVKLATKADADSADTKYLEGFELEYVAGDCEAACDKYQSALEIDEVYAPAAFRLARIYDTYGEGEVALDLYKKCLKDGTVYVKALINLGLVYDDMGDFKTAITCFQSALNYEPNNWRARLYLRDAIESTDMFYDEAERRNKERREIILKTPVSDFELSVRSRNCLAKMNIRILEDLVRKTESEMLAYKNFGETSLKEIKEMLETRELSLGCGREDEEMQAKKERLKIVQAGATNEIMDRSVNDLDLSVRARKCMARIGILTIGDLVAKSKSDLLMSRNFGQTSASEIETKLEDIGLSLRQE